MSNKSQKLVKIEMLLREHIKEILLKEAPLFPVSLNYDYDPAIAGSLLSDFSDWLGETSKLVIQYQTKPFRERSDFIITSIDQILKFIQDYTPKETHVVPNLGKINWDRAFFGTKIPSLGKIYYWQRLTSTSGIAMLSGHQLKYEDAISLGAIPVRDDPGMQQQIILDLWKSGFIKSNYHADKLKILLKSKSQKDVDANVTINNQKYYFVILNNNNSNIHAISTDLRQQDYIYVPQDPNINNPYSGLPVYDEATKGFLKKDSEVETRIDTDLMSLPNMTKFCVETLRIFAIAPETYLGSLILKLPTGSRASYLLCLRRTLIASSVISSIPGVQMTPVGAVAGGLFVASSLVEASINFTLNNYGQGLFSLIVAPLYGASYKMSFIALQTRANDLRRLASLVPNSGIKLTSTTLGITTGPTFSELANAVKILDGAGITVAKQGENVVALSKTGEVIAELDDAWLQIFSGLTTQKSLPLALKIREYIAWYEGTLSWLRTSVLTTGGAALDILFAGATVDQFTEFLAAKDEEMKDKIESLKLPTLPVGGFSRSEIFDIDFNKLIASSYGQKHIKNNNIDTKKITLVDLQTGNYIEGISTKIFENLKIFESNDPSLVNSTSFYHNLTAQEAETIKLLVADTSVYSSLSVLIKTSGNEAVRSKKLVFVPYSTESDYSFLRVLPRF